MRRSSVLLLAALSAAGGRARGPAPGARRRARAHARAPRIDGVRLLGDAEPKDVRGSTETVRRMTEDELLDLIRDHTAPGKWDDEGISLSSHSGSLFVRHTPAVQRRVAILLASSGPERPGHPPGTSPTPISLHLRQPTSSSQVPARTMGAPGSHFATTSFQPSNQRPDENGSGRRPENDLCFLELFST